MGLFNKKEEKDAWHKDDATIKKQGTLKKGDRVTSKYGVFKGEQTIIKVREIDYSRSSYNEGNAISVTGCQGEFWEKYLTKC